MENKSHALAAGLFTLLLIGALVAVALWFRQDNEVRDRYLLVSTTSVSGLSAQASVRFRGVEVGRVESIRFDPANPQVILITALIDRNAPLSKGTRAQLGYQGVTGLAFINLSDEGTDPAPLATDPLDPARIPVDPSVMEQLFARGPALVASVDQVASRLAQLMSDDNQALITEVLSSIQVASEKLGRLADQAGPVLAQATPVLAGVPPMLAQVPPMLKATAAAASDAGAAMRRVDDLVANVNTLTLQLGQRLESIDRITASAERLGRAGEAVGEAVIGVALPRVGDLLEDLSRSVRTLDRVLDDFQQQPQSLLFGRRPRTPGPGEPGFTTSVPAAGQR